MVVVLTVVVAVVAAVVVVVIVVVEVVLVLIVEKVLVVVVVVVALTVIVKLAVVVVVVQVEMSSVRFRHLGATVTTSEAILLQLVGDKDHPKFKEVQALIKTSAPDTGLLTNRL
ncbi:isochorismatase domain-containing protein 1 [Elysia marginata]|uniref:Isochorismatase domain-containing protein 1 n=1 Tax=Elysia marginata TaxID=1093978 RepID=A0AAV4IK72_9GAST|nr:isochorismatase domain-containing protein 1 [Elysia marginata]